MLSLVDRSGTNINVGIDDKLRYDNMIWVPKDYHTKEQILYEAHKRKYTLHPGSWKMY